MYFLALLGNRVALNNPGAVLSTMSSHRYLVKLRDIAFRVLGGKSRLVGESIAVFSQLASEASPAHHIVGVVEMVHI